MARIHRVEIVPAAQARLERQIRAWLWIGVIVLLLIVTHL